MGGAGWGRTKLKDCSTWSRELAEGFLEWVPEQCGTQKALALIYTLGEVSDIPRSLEEELGCS